MNVLEYIAQQKPTLSISELLLLELVRDTRKMLVMAEANQKLIAQMAKSPIVSGEEPEDDQHD